MGNETVFLLLFPKGTCPRPQPAQPVGGPLRAFQCEGRRPGIPSEVQPPPTQPHQRRESRGKNLFPLGFFPHFFPRNGAPAGQAKVPCRSNGVRKNPQWAPAREGTVPRRSNGVGEEPHTAPRPGLVPPQHNLPFLRREVTYAREKSALFEMFFQYRPAPALAAVLTGWLVTGAVLDSQNRTIEAKLLCPQLPDLAVLRQVERELAQVYGLSAVTFHPACAQADPADAPPRRKPRRLSCPPRRRRRPRRRRPSPSRSGCSARRRPCARRPWRRPGRPTSRPRAFPPSGSTAPARSKRPPSP